MDSTFVEINCPVCDSRNFKNLWQSAPRQFLSDYKKSYYDLDILGIDLDTVFYIKKCINCSFVFVNPRFNRDLYHVMYNEAKVNQNHDKERARQDCNLRHLYNTNNKWSNTRVLMRSLSYLHDRFDKAWNEKEKRIRLLDYGCGYGHLLDLCKTFGVEAIGVDIDEYRIQFCRDKGLEAYKPEELDAANKFDIVVSTSVIEHVDNLNLYFQYIANRLESGGYLHLTGLNPKIIKKERRKRLYRLVMPLEHINYFTAHSLDVLVSRYGLKRLKVGNLFQPIERPIDYITPFLKNFIFRGFYPTGAFEADFVKI